MTQSNIDQTEVYRATCAANLEEYKQRQAFINESNKGTLQFAGWVMKAVFLANGAAAITALTFVGNHKTPAGLDPAAVSQAIPCFAWGVVASVLTAMLGYVAQYFIVEASARMPMSYTPKDPLKPMKPEVLTISAVAIVMHIIAVVAALASLGLFVWGMRVAAGQ